MQNGSSRGGPTWKGCVVFRRPHREEQIKSQALEQEREHHAVTVIEFCVVLGRKRRLWEIPKGGMVIGDDGSKCDASRYDTYCCPRVVGGGRAVYHGQASLKGRADLHGVG